MTCKLRIGVGAFVALAFQTNQAFASRITGVTATTDMGSGFGTSLVNTLNGNGLSALTLTATHTATIPSNSWVSAFGVLTGNVTFNLGGLSVVDSFSFWNQNGGGPGAAGSTGIQGVQVLTSTDGVSFAPLAGGPSVFAQVSGATGPPQIFTFAPVSATHFRFHILSDYGDTAETGFAEVGFNNAIPEPSTAALLALGVAALGCLRRRQACVRRSRILAC
jgi:large repetitive protein